jgi:hypothetical protein
LAVIVEKFPELERLTPHDQLELAAELATRAARGGALPDLTAGALEALESQLDYYLKHPESGVAWEELRAQKG